jgi:hypothetical protein
MGNSTNIIELGDWTEKKPKMVYQCHCGSQLFFINASFSTEDKLLLECRCCSNFVDSLEIVDRTTEEESQEDV